MVYFASAAALPGASVANMAAYAAAKGGVITLMRAVAAEERNNGVRANALAPQAIRTDANLSSMGEDHRYVERETVAAWVLWLCSRVAGPVTGQVIRLG
jgi:NAD(P)-dependent dehydrogenase (short-subunit alcohol dehydrogenase family)